jgi:hypothetical protein
MLGVCNGLTLGGITHFTLTIFDECDDGGCCSAPFAIGDDDGLIAFHDGDTGVGCAQVDSDYFFHVMYAFV